MERRLPTEHTNLLHLGSNMVWSGCNTHHGVQSAAQTHVGSWLLTAVQEGEQHGADNGNKAPALNSQGQLEVARINGCALPRPQSTVQWRPWARAAACSGHCMHLGGLHTCTPTHQLHFFAADCAAGTPPTGPAHHPVKGRCSVHVPHTHPGGSGL